MSKEYLNNRWCSPYTNLYQVRQKRPDSLFKKNIEIFKKKENWKNQIIVDIGCGNGRNSVFMIDNGFTNINPFDMKPDFGTKIIIGKDPIPFKDQSVDIVLANYVLMFLSKDELLQVLNEIKRIIVPNGFLMYELYAAKDCEYDNKEKIRELSDFILEYTGFKALKHNLEKGILIYGY